MDDGGLGVTLKGPRDLVYSILYRKLCALTLYSIFNIIQVHHVPCILGLAVPCSTI